MPAILIHCFHNLCSVRHKGSVNLGWTFRRRSRRLPVSQLLWWLWEEEAFVPIWVLRSCLWCEPFGLWVLGLRRSWLFGRWWLRLGRGRQTSGQCLGSDQCKKVWGGLRSGGLSRVELEGRREQDPRNYSWSTLLGSFLVKDGYDFESTCCLDCCLAKHQNQLKPMQKPAISLHSLWKYQLKMWTHVAKRRLGFHLWAWQPLPRSSL